MIDLLAKIAGKCRETFNKLLSRSQRSLFLQNPGSSVHTSFRLGNTNVLDISPKAIFDIGENVTLNHNNFVTVKQNAKLLIGKDSYITRATISCLEEIEIGENCILGEGLKMFDHNHKHTNDPFSVSKTEFVKSKIKIGNNVWTGANVTILKGVDIGDNVILGAGVLIFKDIPANTVVTLKQELNVNNL